VVLVAAQKYTAEQQEEFFRVLDRGATIRAAVRLQEFRLMPAIGGYAGLGL
jgi:hypothetical protein